MKEVLEEGSEEFEMALREVVLLKRLSHINIIRWGHSPSTPYPLIPLSLKSNHQAAEGIQNTKRTPLLSV